MTDTAHPLVRTAHRLADGLLLPEAERVDREGMPRGHVEAVKRSGLLGVVAPVAYGGSGAPPAVLQQAPARISAVSRSTAGGAPEPPYATGATTPSSPDRFTAST